MISEKNRLSISKMDMTFPVYPPWTLKFDEMQRKER